ncbi:uncharacterized protein LOC8155337 [Sorghum bicolor]|uniref:uncharacterized protein LOC8155337 n=1 Tax=Sorghum bicolor TaxID=4558 RepID=UPI000B423DD7|nr:uncharacterized protein LOC8155337 [Sorghum bicolor]|eukprot:XP_021302145.1 uncharacterized protein LOC8155337 [Sorghum bicolor]
MAAMAVSQRCCVVYSVQVCDPSGQDPAGEHHTHQGRDGADLLHLRCCHNGGVQVLRAGHGAPRRRRGPGRLHCQHAVHLLHGVLIREASLQEVASGMREAKEALTSRLTGLLFGHSTSPAKVIVIVIVWSKGALEE